MWMWLVAGFVCVFTYLYYILTTSSGSSYQDNSIDAFIRKGTDERRNEDEDLKPRHENKYKKCYTEAGRQILIVYGTEYGFSEEVARYVFDRLKEVKHTSDDLLLQPRLVNAKHYHVVEWTNEQICLVIISTSGDGVPPSDADEFYNMVISSSTNQYSHIRYSLLAMGDSNYPQFCKTGRTLDKSFSQQCAACIIPCHEVDMEDWSVINNWLDQVVGYLQSADLEIRQDYLDLSGLEEDSGHDRHHPFMATLKMKKLLTVSIEDDDKETVHCEFDIKGSDLTWISGDALGIYPENNPRHVEDIILCLQFSGDECIETPSWAYKPCQEIDTLKLSLMKYFDLKHVKPELIGLMMEKSGNSIKTKFHQIMEKGVSKSNTYLFEYLNTHEVIDVLKEFSPVCVSPTELVSCLKSLQPRYYSISSSPKKDGNTVCVTAAIVRYNLLNRPREGVTTTYLQDRLSVPDLVPVFISRNPDFRLPSNPDLPVILIGPGTGIAPFRAFVQERELAGIKGKTHLYFGCRHKHQDYLYKEELENYEENGTICLRAAFSRDQNHKVYVQDLLQEDGYKIWKLLSKENAHIYVCGDAKYMAHDVDKMLLNIIQMEGNISNNDASQFLKSLEENSRYQKDVWIS